MAKLTNIEIIQKDYTLNKYEILSSTVKEKLYDDSAEVNDTFTKTLLINNKSNIFIKNTTFNNEIATDNLNNISIINTNQSTLNGKKVSIKGNLNTTFNINLNNSQATVKSDDLSTTNLINSRNDVLCFFNFPSPTDTFNFTYQPVMISNGDRTIWSEGKYGWEKSFWFPALPHDLMGRDYLFNFLNAQLSDIKNVHNGSVIVSGTYADWVTISGCTAKIILSGFTFHRLIILDCSSVLLIDCSFDDSFGRYEEMYLVEGKYFNPLMLKQADFSTTNHWRIHINNSKVWIKNAKRDLRFSDFFVGINARNNSQVYLIPENNKHIFISLNLANYNSTSGVRPIFLFASNGSTINCFYEKIIATINYPSANFLGYKPRFSLFGDSTWDIEFEVTNEEYLNKDGKNWRRAKSLLVSLYSLVNNGHVNMSFFKDNNYGVVADTTQISIPPFGLYQTVKTANSPINGMELLGGDTNKMNMYYKGGRAIEADQTYFEGYNNTSYNGYQPHLAHFAQENIDNIEMATITIEAGREDGIRTTTFSNEAKELYSLLKGGNN